MEKRKKEMENREKVLNRDKVKRRKLKNKLLLNTITFNRMNFMNVFFLATRKKQVVARKNTHE